MTHDLLDDPILDHDPLCAVSALLERHTGVSVLSCQCNLIARVREDEHRQKKVKDMNCLTSSAAENHYQLFLSTLTDVGIKYKIAQHFVPAVGVKGYVSVIIFDEDGAYWQCDFTEDGDYISHEVSSI